MESAHHFSSTPDCNSTADVTSFTLRTALSQVNSKQTDKFQGIVSVNDFRIPIGLQELLQVSLGFLWSFCFAWIRLEPLGGHVLHHDCISMFFRDSQPSLRTLWSAVIKSPKFSARGTTLPIRLLHGALVILVLWQISQFRSLGTWVLTLWLPKSSLLIGVGSKETSWEELACESLRSGTLSSTRFSLNSCSHFGMSEYNGSLRSKSWSSFLFGLGILVGLFNTSSDFSEEHGSPHTCLSTLSLDTVAGWWSEWSISCL